MSISMLGLKVFKIIVDPGDQPALSHGRPTKASTILRTIAHDFD